jgi:hypothetical protein
MLCICLTDFADLPYVFTVIGALGPAAGNIHAAIPFGFDEARDLICKCFNHDRRRPDFGAKTPLEWFRFGETK